jgi:uncharacterized protein (TIGR03086 family)
MPTTAERWRNLSDQLTATVDGVPADRWNNQSPCEDWVARDVVGHLVDWMPGLYLGGPVPDAPSVDDDPAAAWRATDAAIYAMLTDPERAGRVTSSPAGEMSLEDLVAMTGLWDLLVHRWDLARATGQDERLDPDEVRGALAGLDPAMSEPMVASGHFQPPVDVDSGADDQTRLLAFFGRRA